MGARQMCSYHLIIRVRYLVLTIAVPLPRPAYPCFILKDELRRIEITSDDLRVGAVRKATNECVDDVWTF